MRFFKLILLSGLFLNTSLFSQVNTKEQAPKEEFKLTETINLDSIPGSEFLKRAVNWVKIENKTYSKGNGVTTGSKAECVATFNIKPKELNPQPDFTGTISMKVSIECKDNKWRYVITKIKHTSTNGKATGGDISNIIPDCGSMVMSDIQWKKIKGEAIKDANILINELKDAMFSPSSKNEKDEW